MIASVRRSAKSLHTHSSANSSACVASILEDASAHYESVQARRVGEGCSTWQLCTNSTTSRSLIAAPIRDDYAVARQTDTGTDILNTTYPVPCSNVLLFMSSLVPARAASSLLTAHCARGLRCTGTVPVRDHASKSTPLPSVHTRSTSTLASVRYGSVVFILLYVASVLRSTRILSLWRTIG
jgi:hypothetical protein